MDALLQTLITVPAFLFALGIIVFVHEFGHFAVAKLFGVRVLTFSLGFGHRLWGFTRGGTDYRISTLPLGGYVRMAGEMPEEATGEPDDFHSKPRWQRILVYVAGPAANVVLSVALIAGVFMAGHVSQGLTTIPPVIDSVNEDSAAEAAGLEHGDLIVRVDGDEVATWGDFDFLVSTSPEKTLSLEVERDGASRSLEMTPTKDPRSELGLSGAIPKFELRLASILADTPADRAGLKRGDTVVAIDGERVSDVQSFVAYVEPRAGREVAITVERGGQERTLQVVPADVGGKGRIGVEIGVFAPLPLLEAVPASVRFNIDIVKKTGQVLGKLFTRQVSAKSTLSGPVEIAVWSGKAARQGPKELIFLMGFLSISIGIMNLLPIPILDGGHITILVAESIMRRDMSVRLKERFTQVGFVMLMTLMAMVIFWDLSKNLPGLFGGG